jgi:hypothetical protein
MARGVNLTSNARLGDVVHRRGLEVGLGETSQTGDAAGSMISSKAVWESRRRSRLEPPKTMACLLLIQMRTDDMWWWGHKVTAAGYSSARSAATVSTFARGA